MSVNKKLIDIKNDVHNGIDIQSSMDKLIVLVGSIFKDVEEKDIMIESVINVRDFLLNGGSKDSFDDVYLLIVNEFSKSQSV